MRQQGSQAARASTEQAAEQAAKEGSAVGLLRVVLKEYDHDNVHMLQLAAKPLLLQEIKVRYCVVKNTDACQCVMHIHWPHPVGMLYDHMLMNVQGCHLIRVSCHILALHLDVQKAVAVVTTVCCCYNCLLLCCDAFQPYTG